MKIVKGIQKLANHHDIDSDKLKVEPFFIASKSNKKNKSLQEFYYEIHKKSMKNIINTYNGKNASEIEAIMVENRKQIEANKRASASKAS